MHQLVEWLDGACWVGRVWNQALLVHIRLGVTHLLADEEVWVDLDLGALWVR